MKYFVSLSTNADPNYAVWAPLAVRVWAIHGYQAIVVLHDDPASWDTPQGKLILHELDDAGAIVVRCPTIAPLSTANTMRCVRWTTPCLSFLHPDDVVLTSDVDIVPIDRDWFRADNVGTFTHLRALMPWRCDGLNSDNFTPADMAPGRMRLSMSYFAASVARWRAILPELVPNDLSASLRNFRFTEDSPAHDELVLSTRVLGFGFVKKFKPKKIGPGRWRRGPLELREPVHASAMYHGVRGLAVPWSDTSDDAVDAITPRGSINAANVVPAWPLTDLLPVRFPELVEWSRSYLRGLAECFRFTNYASGCFIPVDVEHMLPTGAFTPAPFVEAPVCPLPEPEPDVTPTGFTILRLASGLASSWESFTRSHRPSPGTLTLDDEVSQLVEKGLIVAGCPPTLTDSGRARLAGGGSMKTQLDSIFTRALWSR